MRRILLATAAALMMSATASFAVSLTINGTYTLTYTPGTGVGSGGATGAPTFSSAPGDGAVAGPILGNTSSTYYTGVQGAAVTNNPFSETLTVGGSATTVNFFTASPAGSCGSNCSSTTNAVTHTTNTASGTITASFTFTTPSGATGNMSDTAAYYADYNTTNPLSCSGLTSGQSDCVVWSTASDPLVIRFSDGYTLTATLNNAQDWAITPTITFQVRPTPAPEPASLVMLGSAIMGLGLIRRRRKGASVQ